MSTLYSRYFSALGDYQNLRPIDDRDIDGEFNAITTALNRKVLCSGSAPTSPIAGQTWFDTTTKLLKMYRNNEWVSVSTIHVATSAMATPQEGDLWYDTSNNLLKSYNGSGWLIHLVGTAGTENYTAKWDGSGNLVDGYEVKDEDDMSSDSDTVLATQQSIKKYVDDEIDAIPSPLEYAAGDVLIISDDGSDAVGTGGYAKIKEIEIGYGGTLRIKHTTVQGHVSYTVKSKVYRNGVAVGSEHTSDGTLNDNDWSEDISGWSAGDLCQIYAYKGGGAEVAVVKEFRLYTEYPILTGCTVN